MHNRQLAIFYCNMTWIHVWKQYSENRDPGTIHCIRKQEKTSTLYKFNTKISYFQWVHTRSLILWGTVNLYCDTCALLSFATKHNETLYRCESLCLQVNSTSCPTFSAAKIINAAGEVICGFGYQQKTKQSKTILLEFFNQNKCSLLTFGEI